MATLLALVEQTRRLLSDFGGDNEVPWALDDGTCDTDNETLVGHLDQGREEVCYRVPIVDDSTPALTRVALSRAAAGRFELAPRALWLRTLRTPEHALAYRSPSEVDMLYGSTWLAREGVPQCWTYAQERVVQLVPAPAADTDLVLTVDRLPLVSLDWANREAEVADLPPAAVDAVTYWAAYQATQTVRNQADLDLGKFWYAQFIERVGPRPNAQQLAERRRLAAGALPVRSLDVIHSPYWRRF